jgi:hypothetical protein
MSVAANEANETVVTLMHQCLFKSRILSNKEMGKVKAKLQTPEDRDGLISVLNDVGIHPRQVMKNECFEQIGDIIQFCLTLFVHQEFIDNKLLYTILNTSCCIFVMMPGSRKKYLYQFMCEHRIWKSSFVWRDCITYTINSKLD